MKMKVTVKALMLNFAENNQRSLTSETEVVIPLDKCRNYKAHCQTQPLQIWGANCARKFTHKPTLDICILHNRVVCCKRNL